MQQDTLHTKQGMAKDMECLGCKGKNSAQEK
jgi:hypothetical protein